MDEKERFLKFVWLRIENFLDQYSQANYKSWIGPYSEKYQYILKISK